MSHKSKPGTKMVDPEPCKELSRRPQLFMAGILPYEPSLARVLIAIHLVFGGPQRAFTGPEAVPHQNSWPKSWKRTLRPKFPPIVEKVVLQPPTFPHAPHRKQSARLSSTQLDSARLSSTQLDSARLGSGLRLPSHEDEERSRQGADIFQRLPHSLRASSGMIQACLH